MDPPEEKPVDEMLEEQRAALRETIEFFAPANKPKLELWVATNFVQNLNVPFDETEFKSVADDPPDVTFRDGRFEIKEILDPNRRRHDEYRAASERADAATSLDELTSLYSPRRISIAEVCALIEERSARYLVHYAPAVRRSLDLVVYVNLKHIDGLDEVPFPNTDTLASHGWRSVSFLKGHRSCTLVAQSDAPTFITGALGTVVHRAFPAG